MCRGLKQKESDKSTSRSRNSSSKVASEDFQLHAVRGSQEEKQSFTEQTRLETEKYGKIQQNTLSAMFFFNFSTASGRGHSAPLRMSWTGWNLIFPRFCSELGLSPCFTQLGPEAETVGVGAACGPLGIWALTFQAGGLALDWPPKIWIVSDPESH